VEAGLSVPVVWAIADAFLVNYLLPRDCPRICMRVKETTSEQDRQRYVGPTAATAVIVIEEDWYERAAQTVLWLYEMPSTTFRCVDENAGYYLSEEAVVPQSATPVRAPLDFLTERGAELKVVLRLRPLAADVIASTLAYSIIRLRNARSAT
jgi:hypothetical protein